MSVNYRDPATGDLQRIDNGKILIDSAPTAASGRPVSSGGTYTALQSKTDLSNLATVESSTTVSKAYAADDLLIYGGQLYKVISAIASGGTITTSGTGQNVSATTLDANLGGSSSTGGHIIENDTGVDMAVRTNLQFVGVSVTDDSTNDRTVVDVTGKADKVSSATNGNFAGLDSNGNLIDSGSKASDFLTSHQDITGKADKVISSTNGNFAGLDSNGNLTDSGHKHSDYLTSHQDISGKADKVSNAINGNFAAFNSNGNLKDSGRKASDFLTQHQDISGKADKVTSATNGNFAGLNSNGNLTDSGSKASDFASSSHTHTISQISDFPTLGTASSKDSTSSVTQSSTDLVESGAVYTAINTAIGNAVDNLLAASY